MHHDERALRQSFNAHQSELLNTIADYRFLASGRMAARDRLERVLTDKAILRELGSESEPRTWPIRRQLGASFVRLGSWLGGIATSPTPVPLAPNSVAIEERSIG